MHPERKAICPLFNFQIPEVSTGRPHEEAMKYLRMLRRKCEEGIEVLDNVRIRRIRKEDLEGVRKWGMVAYYADIFSRINASTFVIEIPQRDLDMKEIESKIHNILLAMRLHKMGSVYCMIMWFLENSKYDMKLAILDTHVSDMMGGQYYVEIGEFQEIRKLAEQIDKIDLDKRKSFRIACGRFSRAYEEHREDEILIDFMIAFEALFLRGERAPSNTGQFIGLGCSVLLGNNDREREEINNFLIKAYNIRNKIVHGSEYKTPIQINNEDYSMRDFVLKLQQYLSESIRKLLH